VAALTRTRGKVLAGSDAIAGLRQVTSPECKNGYPQWGAEVLALSGVWTPVKQSCSPPRPSDLWLRQKARIAIRRIAVDGAEELGRPPSFLASSKRLLDPPRQSGGGRSAGDAKTTAVTPPIIWSEDPAASRLGAQAGVPIIR
jgi:hypothetical protein